MEKGKFAGEAEKGWMGIYLFTSDICRIRYARLGFFWGGEKKWTRGIISTVELCIVDTVPRIACGV